MCIQDRETRKESEETEMRLRGEIEKRETILNIKTED
jgi:hypothetical protein